MKKYKVNIPEGYYVESTTTDAPPTSIQINLKPIKKQLPKTWEEYCKNNESFLKWDNNINIPTNREPEFRALLRLVELRDHYNDGWEPDWTNDYEKYIIYIHRNTISEASITNESHVLIFKAPFLRDEFLSNFRDLIETAKPLL